jgi:hypothetical protein
MAGSDLKPYFAAPYGDMMLVGCFGMLTAVRDVYPDLRDELDPVVSDQRDTGTAPWDY